MDTNPAVDMRRQDLLKFYFMDINCIFIPVASTYSLSYFPVDT